MKEKLVAIFGSVLLSALLTVGCATNDQNPPPDDDGVNVQDPTDNEQRGGENPNDGKNGNIGDNNDGNINDNNNMNDNNGNDVNRNGDGDLMKDDNTPGEEMIEDRDDANDPDNVDR